MSFDQNLLSYKLQYTFNDATLLENALTHRSVSQKNNERLEFLGDSILNFVIASELYDQYPELSEGDLSRLRAMLVNKDFLASLAVHLELGQHLILGVGELKSGGHRRNSILADAVEAILGAIYLDAGFQDCSHVIKTLFYDALRDISNVEHLKDPKTRLQELLQAQKQVLPEYELVQASGKPHNQTFRVICRVDGIDGHYEGTGKSLRKAEQEAAEKMLARLLVDTGKINHSTG